MDIAIHELCKILPPMSNADYSALRDDIKAKGLVHPITMYEGKILDGRHRYRACLEAGVQPRFSDYDGGDPKGFVVSSFKHRNLTESQLAMVALGFMEYEKQQAKARMSAGGKAYSPKEGQADRPTLPENTKQARDAAAARVGVGGRSVSRASLVAGAGIPELVDKVRSGEITLSEAENIAKSSPVVQRRIVEINDKRKRKEELSKSNAMSNSAKARKHRESSAPPVVKQNGTFFLRTFLAQAERMAINLREQNLKTAEDIAKAFFADMDFDCQPLALQYERCKPVIDAFMIIENGKENERRSKGTTIQPAN